MRSVQSVILILITILFLSCSKKAEHTGQVSLSVLNDSIYYYALGDSLYEEGNRSYTDSTQKAKSYNVIKYRLTNDTDKKLMFFMKDIELVNIYGLYINITHNGDTIPGENILGHPAMMDDCGICELKAIHKKNMDEYDLFKTLGVEYTENQEYYKKYLNQTVVIAPGESWDFSSILSLPIVIDGKYIFRLPATADLRFTLNMYIDKNKILECITKNDSNNLKKNNIEIFDGKISSNIVKLIPRY
jgi:hypothetical protein